MNDMTPLQDEAAQLAQLRAQMQAEVKAGTFGAASLIRLAEALERVPAGVAADARVRLAFEAVDAIESSRVVSNMTSLARLLRAAGPTDPKALTPAVARRFRNMSGLVATVRGRPAEAVRQFAISLAIAEQLSDPVAAAAVWNNLALLAGGCGIYEDAVGFSTIAERTLAGSVGDDSRRLLLYAAQHRANALHRLGRLDAALADFALAAVFGLASAPTEAAPLTVFVAEILIERGDNGHARLILDGHGTAIPTPHVEDTWGLLALRRVRALLLVAQGDFHSGLADLESVLTEALRVSPEASSDDIVVDTLYSLEFSYRLAGDSHRARDIVHRIGARLRSNAEAALAAIAEEPGLALSRNPATALRDLDTYIVRRAQAAGEGQHAAVATLQQLIALAAGATAAEDTSGEHGVRVAALARAVAKAMTLDEVSSRLATIAGLIHDAGKFGVPHAVFTSPEPLSADDQDLLDAHAENGAQMIERAAIPDRGRLAEIVRLHHYPYDGVGGQRPLRGDDIPIEARIVAACDRFDSLVIGRPRRAVVPIAEALREILRQSGREFDPRVVEVLIETVRQLQRDHADLMAYLAEDADQYDFTAARRMFRIAAAA